MMICLTSASMILPKAAPITTPTAKEMTLPLNAKVLNSSKSEAFFGGGALCPLSGEPLGAARAASPGLNTPAWKPLPTLSTTEPRPRLPDFEIVGELGRGGMGIGYAARQLSRVRTVALKVIRKDRLVH